MTTRFIGASGLGMILVMVMSFCLSARAQLPGDGVPNSDRIVHRFDFNERGMGNLDDVPMYWLPLRPEGFPGFADGSFDFEVGATAPPSFYLNCNGRNVAYQYVGADLPVRANSEYRIAFALKPHNLRHARACVSAYFVDKQGDLLLHTMARSRYVGGESEPDDWIPLVLMLPAAPREAESIALSIWVLQEPQWRESVPKARHIPRVDVHAGVWVDDIVVRTLPRVELSTSAPGNVLAPGEPHYIRIILADTEKAGLVGRLSIKAADGGLVQALPLGVSVDEFVEPTLVPVDHLVPGYYKAVLEVLAGETIVTTRQLAFAKLAPLPVDGRSNARPFGVVVHPQTRSDAASELALLRNQLVRSVKLPIWTGLAEDLATPMQRKETDRMYLELITEGFAVTGVLFGAPSAIVRRDGPYQRTLIDLLSDQPGAWDEHLAVAAAPYASFVRSWQIGSDDGPHPLDRKKIATAVSQLREAMRRFISSPLLAMSETTAVSPSAERLPVEHISLNIGSEIPSAWMGRVLEESKGKYARVAAYIEPLPTDRYRRLPRLADWAQRLITARFEGADTVFAPQTWRVRKSSRATVTEPTEEYVILRTIAGLIGSATPGQRVSIAPGVVCMAFHDGRKTVLAMWDPSAPAGGREYAIQLGKADRQFDLWGQSSSLQRDGDGRHLVQLSSLPVIVPNVERWLIDFRTSLSIAPRHIESGTEVSDHEIELVHLGHAPISGEMTLQAPPGWKISPKNLSFSLMPQRTEHFSVRATYPHNEVAETKQIVAQVRLITGSYYLEIPLAVEFGLQDVEVSGMIVTEKNDVILRHTVTNHTDETLHFRGVVQARGRQRQYRPLANLRPGDTQTVEYRFSNATDLTGSTVRLGLREVNDGARTHALELVVP